MVLLGCFVLCLIPCHVNSEALTVTKDNYQDTLNNYKIVFLNFYADWCMFSQQLAPIFHQTADIIQEEHSNVKLGRVDCEVEQDIAQKNGVSKYPTIKLFRNGKALRKEYRGQRSVNAFSQFIKQQLKDVVTDVTNPADLKIDVNRNTFVGYFNSKGDDAYNTFAKLCDEVFETVDCVACLGESFNTELAVGENVVFKPKKSLGEQESSYTGSLTDIDVMRPWLNDKAHPLVREITFENGEELTEEGLPFLLLFHGKGDTKSIQRFKDGVMRELLDERSNINFLTADGTTFSHPLHHLGKSVNDLPIICIDSFRHMYLFKKFSNVDVPGKLKKFVQDLHSGKLHQDFHNPPAHDEDDHDIQEIPETPKAPAEDQPKPPEIVGDGVIREHVPSGAAKQDSEDSDDSTKKPPETIFQKLAPSNNRYSFRDEL